MIKRQKQTVNLGGGFKYFICSPVLGEDSHFDSYFSDGLVQPLIRNLLQRFCDKIQTDPRISINQKTKTPKMTSKKGPDFPFIDWIYPPSSDFFVEIPGSLKMQSRHRVGGSCILGEWYIAWGDGVATVWWRCLFHGESHVSKSIGISQMLNGGGWYTVPTCTVRQCSLKEFD